MDLLHDAVDTLCELYRERDLLVLLLADHLTVRATSQIGIFAQLLKLQMVCVAVCRCACDRLLKSSMRCVGRYAMTLV